MLWLSIRARWRRAFGPSLAVALLIGLIGGFVLASLAAARRVEGAYQSLIREIDPPDLLVTAGCGGDQAELTGCRGEALPDIATTVTERLTGSSVVGRARPLEIIRPYLVDRDGAPVLASSDDPSGCFEGDHDVHVHALEAGGPLDQVMPFRLEGDLRSEGARGVVLARSTAVRVGLGIGDHVRVAGWCSGDGDPVEVGEPIDLRVTGLLIGAFDVEPPGTNRAFEPMYVDLSVFEALRSAGAEPFGGAAVWLADDASPDEVGEELASYAVILDLHERTTTFDDALADDSRLLWMLALVGAATGILILAPIIGRNLRDTADPPVTIVALGATPRQVTQQAAVHVGVLASIGALTGAALGVLFSVAMPIGLGEAILPSRELWFDWLVTTAGFVSTMVLVFTMAAVPAWRSGRTLSSGRAAIPRRQNVDASLRLRPAVHTGLLTAVGRPAGQRRASPWPSLISISVAGVVCFASLTYLAGLRHLQQSSRLVGWNWDGLVQMDDNVENLDLAAVTAQINEIEGVAAVTRGWLYPPVFPVEETSNRQVYAFSFDTGVGGITPSIVRGRAPHGPDEVAINSVLADETELGVGDTMTFSRPALVSRLAEEIERNALESGLGDRGIERPVAEPVGATFEITGIAVLAIERTEDYAGASFTLAGFADLAVPSADEVDTARAWLPANLPLELQKEAERSITNAADIENAPPAYIRFSGDPVAAAHALETLAGVDSILIATPDQVINDGLGLNLSSRDRVPLALTLVVSVAMAMVLLYLLLVAVRARRSEIAVLRALGLTNRGIHLSVAAQATVTVLLPMVIAIPAGVVFGRLAWITFAGNLDVIPESPTPWVQIAIAAAVALAIANLTGLFLAWLANRRSSGRDLHTE
ncbi:MAG: ABC transporter permease [Ilumatobacteraceae bacterium]